MKNKKNRIDWIFTTAIFLLCIFGGVFVYSASYYIAERDYADKFFFLKKQIVGYVIGWIAFFFLSFFDYHKYKKISKIIFVISLIALAMVLSPLGKESYGAKRWIGIGGFTIQPSEITKLAFVIFAAVYFSNDLGKTKTFKGILPVLLAGGISCLLIILEPNMSVTVCMGCVMLAMLFFAGVKIKQLLIIIIPIMAVIPLLIILEPYRMKRLLAFLDPWASPKGEGYQLIQSLYALGSGGLFGVGVFNSRQKMRFLPFAESDFILSVIGEEGGFFGIVTLLFVVGIICWRIILTAKKSSDFLGYFLAVGIFTIFIVQIAVNALVVTGSIPPTGIPFPLVSSGNTQIIIFMASFGIVNNIGIQNKNLESRYELTKKSFLS